MDTTFGLLDVVPKHDRYEGHLSPLSDVTEQILQLISKGVRVLDVGCSNGNLMKHLKELYNAEVYGIEPDKGMAKEAIERGFDVQHCNFEDFKMKDDKQFDVIIFADVLEHLINPGAALTKAYNLLKNDGVVIASIPNVAHWTVRINLLFGKFEYESVGLLDATHLRWFTRKSLDRILKKTNFMIESITYSEGSWLPAYSRQLPWKWIRPEYRKQLIKKLVCVFPTLFACQFIIKASKLKSA